MYWMDAKGWLYLAERSHTHAYMRDNEKHAYIVCITYSVNHVIYTHI